MDLVFKSRVDSAVGFMRNGRRGEGEKMKNCYVVWLIAMFFALPSLARVVRVAERAFQPPLVRSAAFFILLVVR